MSGLRKRRERDEGDDCAEDNALFEHNRSCREKKNGTRVGRMMTDQNGFNP
jgi:hypothetical protein